MRPTLLGAIRLVITVAGLYLCMVAAQACAQDHTQVEGEADKELPADSGIVDVKADYGAKGDGATDDTESIQKAIEVGIDEERTVYFPEGTYLVSDRLEGKNSKGEWWGQMKLWGENQERTLIKLTDNAPGYSDPAKPKAVLYTASSLFVEDPYGGGRDWPRLGEGNEAFGNYVENLTV